MSVVHSAKGKGSLPRDENKLWLPELKREKLHLELADGHEKSRLQAAFM
jgi:hypothetical protein